MVRVSVITISYNSILGLKKTVQSVLSQDYTEIEHIIVDGNSIDGSKALINDYRDTYLEKGVELNFISEPDEGIYDAMNKGTKNSSGEYLIYMNSGDIFYSTKTISTVFNKNLPLEESVVIYGANIFNNELKKPKSIQSLEWGIIFANHQSMFFNAKRLGIELFYNKKYKIYADYELVNRIYLKFGIYSFYYIEEIISVFEEGGISSTPSYTKRKDKYQILFRNYGAKGVFKAILFRLGC